MTEFKGAIFDLDGTLLDSMAIWETVAPRYLKTLGINLSADEANRVRDMSIQQFCTHFCALYGLNLTEKEIMDGVYALIGDFYKYQAPLKDGVLDVLDTLKRRGVKMCIATATDRWLVEPALERTGLAPYFSAVFTCGETGRGKNEPDIFLNALGHLGTAIAQTILFEDALYAIRTAKAAGFSVAAIYDDSAADHQAEIKALADFYLTSWSDFDRLFN